MSVESVNLALTYQNLKITIQIGGLRLAIIFFENMTSLTPPYASTSS